VRDGFREGLPAVRGMASDKGVKIGRVIRIDGIEGNWKIIDAGTPRPDYIVEAYAENGRKGLPDGQGPSTPMRDVKNR
jgi:hypothetical protein